MVAFQEDQVELTMQEFRRKSSALDKYVFLQSLQVRDAVDFIALAVVEVETLLAFATERPTAFLEPAANKRNP